jgi:hypothetical protein
MRSHRRPTTISSLHWVESRDETERGWWYTVNGIPDILESGTLNAGSDRERVLAAIARKLHVDSVIEYRKTPERDRGRSRRVRRSRRSRRSHRSRR